MRKNKIAKVKEADLERIVCVYSPAKRRGPPPKRTLDYREMEERWERDQEKRQRGHPEEQPIAGVGQASREMPSTPNLNNMDVASILNLLGSILNPPAPAPASAPTLSFSQNPPVGNPLMQPPPIDPLTAALQSILSTLGSALGSQGTTMASQGYAANPLPAASSTATQQLAYLQQLQQQLQLQQFLQQQLTLPRTEQGQTSSMSSSGDEEKTQSLQSEVERLRKRVNELEAENASLKQREMALMLQMRERENRN